MNRPRRAVAAALADAFRAGEWDPPAMAARGRAALATRRRTWIEELARAVRSAYPDRPDDRARELAEFIEACPPFLDAWRAADGRLRVRSWLEAPTAMGTNPGGWAVRPLPDVAALREWLGLTSGELAWFADTRSLERSVTDERLRHYRYTWVAKPGGGRLLEAPKPRLKAIQRQVLDEVLAPIPVHDAAHGFRAGRGVHTSVAPHVGRDTVVHLDLEAFFVSVGVGRVFAILRTAGYPEPVAHLLTALTTNAVPVHVARHVVESSPRARRLVQALRTPHLPQGAPTSPALANLAARGLDRRIAGLARSVGAGYTRYADDLVLSGGRRLADHAPGIVAAVERIAVDEGFRVNEAKTTVRRRHQRQQVTGVVVNGGANVPREDYDRLRALLHNAARHGPASQNRQGHPHFRSHVLGRISWVASLNPARGDKLREAFDRVDW